VPVVDQGAGQRGGAEQHQRPHHHVAAAVTIADAAGDQRADQEAELGAAREQAGFDAGQMPLGSQHRQQECDDRRIDGLEHVAKPAHQQQPIMKSAEWQSLKAFSNVRHCRSPSRIHPIDWIHSAETGWPRTLRLARRHDGA
jgi:hypothetical protein